MLLTYVNCLVYLSGCVFILYLVYTIKQLSSKRRANVERISSNC